MTDRMVSVEALCARLNEYPIPTRIGITAVMKLIEEVATQGADGESLRPVAITDMQRVALQQVREILRKGDWKYYGEVVDELLATRATPADQSRDSVIEEKKDVS